MSGAEERAGAEENPADARRPGGERKFPPAAPCPEATGFLLVDKPKGPTSHDLVSRVRGRFKVKKVGHGGTLDPMATGLMILLLGKATKLSDRVMGHDKVYEGTMKLGVETDTQDAEGEVVAERDASGVTREALEAAMEAMRGDRMQTPPMASARKVGGVPLYKLAREGKVVEREARLIHVYRFDLLEFAPPEARFRVACTKGTYVRTLAHDVGAALGCGAHLSALRRTKVGDWDVAQAHPFEEIMEAYSLKPYVLPMEGLGVWGMGG
ncbi:MAG: tRNA pseudouridine(55) synthase TruB [Kiritimatiellae bacterium]|nr:tRNA pseudouridine(55) synthase TruB [Kiritimatiellia bacterium]